MKILDIPRSGRCGDFVFYMRGSKQCRRRYIVPNDPRTAGQLRARAAFGAASKAWSWSEQLTEEQREAWRTEGAKVQSRPRLGQSGPLTGQNHFIGRNCAKGQIGREENAERIRQKAESTSQVVQSQNVAQSTRETHRRCGVVAPCQTRRGRGCARKEGGKRASLQAQQSQWIARSTWERYRSASVVTPEQHRRGTGCPRGVGVIGAARGHCVLAGVRRNAHWRELWHGS
jgi:hypothetical protein